MPEEASKPTEVAHLKFVASEKVRAESARLPEAVGLNDPSGTKPAQASSGAENVPSMLRHWAWWKACGETVVRKEMSLSSPEVGRVEAEKWVQQRGPAKKLADGLIRMPVLPEGWVTADASSVGGPRLLQPASLWRVVHKSGSSRGEVLVRREAPLDSEEIATLRRGEVVQQIGPQAALCGIVRVRVAVRSTANSPPPAGSDGQDEWDSAEPAVGWITLDAREAGGPLFFEACIESGPI